MTLLDSLLRITQLPQPVAASDGTLYRDAWAAFLHDLIELKWQRLLPILTDGAVVRQTRCDLRLTQAELAQEAGISQQLLAMLETGQRRMSDRIVQKIWGAFWRLRQTHTPAVDLLIRLDDELNTVIVTERVPL